MYVQATKMVRWPVAVASLIVFRRFRAIGTQFEVHLVTRMEADNH